MTEKEKKEMTDNIREMMEEARRIVDDAKREARELKQRAREERRRGYHRRHGMARHRKKEKVLNLRIGSDLEEKIKAEAERLSVPVSTLVRNVLDNAFDLVDGISRRVGDLVDNVVEDAGEVRDTFRSVVKDCFSENAESGETRKVDESEIEDVVMWQEVTLGRPVKCAACETSIPRWYKAHAGRNERSNSTLFLCKECMGKSRPEESQK